MDAELEQLGEAIAEQAAHLDAATHRLLTDLRAFDQRGGWHVQGAMSCAHWLSWRVGWDLVTARERVRIAARLGELPAIDDALRRGAVSYSKVRAMARVATPANEALLLGHAQLMTAAQLEKLSRRYALVQRHGEAPHPLVDVQRRRVRRRDTEDGMVKIEAVLHPEEAELVWAMLDHAAARLASARAGGDSAEARGGEPRVVEPAQVDRAGDDSAEPGGSGLEPAEPVPVDRAGDDSAEAEEGRCGAVRSARAGLMVSVASGDSAEAGDGGPQVVAAAPVDRAGDDSAEARTARCGTVKRNRAGATVSEASGDSAEAGAGWPRPTNDATGRREPSVLRERVDATRRAFDRADALVALAQGYLRGERPNRTPIEVVVTITERALRGEAVDAVAEIGATFVSPETARRLACDAGVIELVEDGHGAPLSVGRKRRAISGALKRALRARDATCRFPGCTHRTFLEGHHIQHWAAGGETSLRNALLLCDWHHRHVHEYGYTIELGDDQRPRFRDPQGRVVPVVPPRPTPADLGWPWLLQANAALAIDAMTAACGWDGKRAPYGAIVGHLLAADGAG